MKIKIKKIIWRSIKTLRPANLLVQLFLAIRFSPRLNVTFGKGVAILNPKQFRVSGHCEIGNYVRIQAENINIGHGSFVGHWNSLYGRVAIGNYFMSGPGVSIIGGNHGTLLNGVPMVFQESVSNGIVIGNDVWVGANTTILDGAIVEDGVVIGGGAVVRGVLESNGIYAGNPARLIKFRQ